MSILTEEHKKLVDALRGEELGSDKYLRLLDAIEKIRRLISEEAPEEKLPVEKVVESPAITVGHSKEDQTKTEYVYTKEAVREILTDASKNGVKIQPIMKQFIPEGQPAKLSSVPAASYAALVEAVQNAG